MHLALKGENTMKMGADSLTILESAIQTANDIKDLDFVILTGDLLQDGEPFNLDMMRFQLDQLNVPYYVILGNHDMSVVHAHDAKGPLFPSISKSTFVWAFQNRGFKGTEFYWSLEPVKGIQLIGLDSTIPGTWGGTIPPKQLKWLDNELSKNKNKLCIPIAHHNFIEHTEDDFQTTQNFLVNNAKEVRKIFEKHSRNVQFAISGHHHLVSLKKQNNITYFSNPSTTTYPTQYTLYTLSPNSLNYEVKWLPIPSKIIQEAKDNLLKDDWWRPTGMSNTKEGNQQLLLQFMGTPEEQKGSIPLKPVDI